MSERISQKFTQESVLSQKEAEKTSKNLDLEDPNNWTPENAEQAAEKLGFVCDEKFIGIYADYCEEVVTKATVNGFLIALARKWFEQEGCKSV